MNTVVEKFAEEMPIHVDDGLLELCQVGGCTGRYRLLDALADEGHQITASVVSCAAAITVPSHSVKARDL